MSPFKSRGLQTTVSQCSRAAEGPPSAAFLSSSGPARLARCLGEGQIPGGRRPALLGPNSNAPPFQTHPHRHPDVTEGPGPPARTSAIFHFPNLAFPFLLPR